MKYRVDVYVARPRAVWMEELDAGFAIFIGESPWLWLARMVARSHIGNTGRCGYVISDGEIIVEHVEAASPAEFPQ